MNKMKVEDEKLMTNQRSQTETQVRCKQLSKRIDLYKRFLKKDTLSDIERLTVENKKEWMMSHLLNLIIEQELRGKITDLTKRVYRLQAIQPDNG